MEDRLRVIFEEWARDNCMVIKRFKNGYVYQETDQCWKAVLSCTRTALNELDKVQSTANKDG